MKSGKLLLVSVVSSCCVFGQAWLPQKGQGTASLLYQFGFDRYHVFSDGSLIDAGHIFLHSALLDVDYAVTNRLAVKFALPYIQGKYDGVGKHQWVRGMAGTESGLDDGDYHGSFQDFRVDVRYNVNRRGVMLTPFFQAIIPSHSYPFFGHPAIGTGTREFRSGINMGRRLNPFLPKAYVQGRYAFGVTERTVDITPKRSYGEFQLGYFLTRRIAIQGSGVLTISHNGVEFIPGLFPNDLSVEHWINHDRITRGNLLDLGASSVFSIRRGTTVFAGWGHSVYGENGHMRGVVITVGITKSFTTPLAGERPSGRAFLPDPNRALVCTCAKTR